MAKTKNSNDVLVNFKNGGPLDGAQRAYPRERVKRDQTLVLPFAAQCGLEHVYASYGAITDVIGHEIDVFYQGLSDTC